MKATLEFNLPEDKDDFELATKGGNWYSVVWDMDQWLRSQYKHMPDEEYSEDRYNAYYEARQKLNQIINDNGVNLDDIS